LLIIPIYAKVSTKNTSIGNRFNYHMNVETRTRIKTDGDTLISITMESWKRPVNEIEYKLYLFLH
jgi:hypothetical protein